MVGVWEANGKGEVGGKELGSLDPYWREGCLEGKEEDSSPRSLQLEHKVPRKESPGQQRVKAAF